MELRALVAGDAERDAPVVTGEGGERRRGRRERGQAGEPGGREKVCESHAANLGFAGRRRIGVCPDVGSGEAWKDGAVGQSVLIVDDHADFRAFARALLKADGFEVVGEAHDGASALAAARSLKPALVLLDIQLPDIDGFAVCEALAGDDGRARDRADLEPRRVLVPPAPGREQRARLHPEGRALGAALAAGAGPRRRRALAVALVVAGLALGIAAEWAAYEPGELDRAAGRPADRLGVPARAAGSPRGAAARALGRALMAATGAAWFAGTLAPGALLYLHRGPARPPAARLPGRPRGAPAGAGGGRGGLRRRRVEPLGRSAALTLALAAAVAAVAVAGYLQHVRPAAPRARRPHRRRRGRSRSPSASPRSRSSQAGAASRSCSRSTRAC